MKKQIFLKFLFSIYFLITWNKVLCKNTFITLNTMNIEKCIPYAYGNFNGDKFMDIYCVSNSGKTIEIWVGDGKDSILFNQFKVINLNDTIVVNLVPGDFNGDSVIDLLVVHKPNASGFRMRLYIGVKSDVYSNDIPDNKSIDYEYVLTDQPLAADLNGDGIMDLFGQDQEGRKYFYFDTFGKITPILQVGSANVLYTGYSNAVIDANNDYMPDLLVTTKDDNNNVVFEIWEKVNNIYQLNNTYTTPSGIVVYGQSLYADFDSDGSLEHLLPACKDIQCKNSSIFVYKNNQWIELPINFNEYGFLYDSTILNENMSISAKFGDYNLDGYVDLLVVVYDIELLNQSKKSSALLLQNIPCADETICTVFTRTFKTDINEIQTISNVVVASFFDLFDDGNLDVILLVEDKTDSINPYKIVALKNEMYDDVYFLKVMILSGCCGISGSNPECPFKKLPYGMNYGTPFTRIQMKSFDYSMFTIYASQLSQSSHLSLQLPFTIFGLGSTANFVDSLTVGIEILNENKDFMPLHKEWTSIIPNSQLIVTVNPRIDPFYWTMQLFMGPSKNILITGISLLSTMVLLIFGIILLQYREKKIDEKERKLESQRFHFDGL